MIDLKDITFTIPVKIDHEDRSRNLRSVVSFLSKNFDTNIIICEQDTEEVKSILKGFDFTYIKTKRTDDHIHRTYQLNVMAKHAKTPFIANYDADVVAQPKQYVETQKLLREGASMVIPYAGPCYDIPVQLHKQVEEGSVEHLEPIEKIGHLMNPNSVGGALFWNREDFIKGGMENEHFISWGFEDNERFHRFPALGYSMKRASGSLYHLNHFRTPNSNHKHKFYNGNQREYNRIKRMNKSQLLEEVKKWEWCR